MDQSTQEQIQRFGSPFYRQYCKNMKNAIITNYPGFAFSGFNGFSTLFLRAIQQKKNNTFLCVETNPETMSITNWIPEIAEAVSEKFMNAPETKSEQQKNTFIKKASWIAAYPPRAGHHSDWVYALLLFESPLDVLWDYCSKEEIANKLNLDVSVLTVCPGALWIK